MLYKVYVKNKFYAIQAEFTNFVTVKATEVAILYC
jgi:hypothetical protein